MKIRADVAKLLRAGLSDRAIGAHLHTDPRAVRKARRALGIDNVRPGRAPATITENFHARTRPVEGGHLDWTGHRDQKGMPLVRTGGKTYSAHRVAFRLRHGREPVGHVLPGCDRDGCVAPDHVEDRPMRERNRKTYAAIFGRSP